jgi:transcription-repair coupling factor (superfamily II helicase)
VPPGKQKIEVYRKLSGIATAREFAEFEQELRDRFGHLPDAARRLLDVKQLQILAGFWEIDDVHLEERFAVFGYRDAGRIRALAKRVGSDLRIADERDAYYLLPDPESRGDALLETLISVLQPG